MSAGGYIIADLGKAADQTCLRHDGERQHLVDPEKSLQSLIGWIELHPIFYHRLDLLD